MKYLFYTSLFFLTLISCKKEDPGIPVVITGQPVITANEGLEFRGKFVSVGTENWEIVDHGFAWTDGPDAPSPRLRDLRILSLGKPEAPGSFNATVKSGFISGKNYQVRAFVTVKKLNHHTSYFSDIYGNNIKFVSLGGTQPAIDSIYPEEIFPGDKVKLYAHDFFYLSDDIKVLFNTSTITPESVTGDYILFTVPASGIRADNSIGIKSSMYRINLPDQLSAPLAAPKIISVSPLKGTTGDTVHILGDHFIKYETSIWLNEIEIPASNNHFFNRFISSGELQFILPADTDSGLNTLRISTFDKYSPTEESFKFQAPYVENVYPETLYAGDSITIGGQFFMTRIQRLTYNRGRECHNPPSRFHENNCPDPWHAFPGTF